jgi:antitoxin (DNA-binding transcriptional repressor) of toxin-antitoxin stability system
MMPPMYTVDATDLKNRLGAVLARAGLEPVAVRRHGRVVAYLTPATPPKSPGDATARRRPRPITRREEEALARLCASGDLRPSRWARAGDPRLLAGVATMLASQPEFDRMRLLALAERLHPGVTTPEGFARWLEAAPVKAARFLPLVRAELRQRNA